MDNPIETKPEGIPLPKDRVFGIVDENDRLLYSTVKLNPLKTLRAAKKQGIPLKGKFLAELALKRRRKPGDVAGLSMEALRSREPYIGPMR